MGLVTLCRNYLRWTQAVVVAPLIAGAKRHWLKVAWSLVLLATTVAFLVQSYYLFTNHLAYKTTTNTKLIYEPEASFPAVTVCNLNPFKKSMVEHSRELKNLLATYIYVIKVKQAQIRSGITAAARSATTVRDESHARAKRQEPGNDGTTSSGCNGTRFSYADMSTPQNYSVWNCADGTSYMEFEGCNVKKPLRTNSFPASLISGWKDEMATVFYKCFETFCTEGNCGLYQDGFSAIRANKDCLVNEPGDLTLDWIVAQVLGSYCNYADYSCSLGMPGNYGNDEKQCDTGTGEVTLTTIVSEASEVLFLSSGFNYKTGVELFCIIANDEHTRIHNCSTDTNKRALDYDVRNLYNHQWYRGEHNRVTDDENRVVIGEIEPTDKHH